MLLQGIVAISFQLDGQTVSIHKLLVRYANLPMSLADACLVRMAEQDAQSLVMTLDRDFRVYRKNGRQTIPTLIPDDI